MATVTVPNSTHLVRYEAMVAAIAAAYEVDEVKEIRNRAVALEAYARQARNVEAERQCVEIRIRAERRAGELLKQMEKAKGSPGNQYTGPLDRGDGSKTLSDLGISYDQSAIWQRLADVPDDKFEAALRAEDKPSTSGIIRATEPDRARTVRLEVRKPSAVQTEPASRLVPVYGVAEPTPMLTNADLEIAELRELDRDLDAIVNRYGANRKLVDILQLIREAKVRIAEKLDDMQQPSRPQRQH